MEFHSNSVRQKPCSCQFCHVLRGLPPVPGHEWGRAHPGVRVEMWAWPLSTFRSSGHSDRLRRERVTRVGLTFSVTKGEKLRFSVDWTLGEGRPGRRRHR